MRKGLHKRTDEAILQWFTHVKRMERDKIAKSVLVVVKWVSHGRDGMIP